ncbi:MAG: saccharopine dehydrogenase NADP-binding domain-containing protein [Actinomycetota bacterium]|nr:saccharopine dehydrogenase NADP-binding domain-containing protein [Actinomycetota bacterium]
MAGRIVLFGATGYTGELTARALVERGAQPVLAGRSRERVQALADKLGGLQSAIADVSRPRSIAELVERGDVLVTTVGPFVRYGAPAVHAAIAAGAHYIDSTGEPSFIRDVFERYGPEAQTAGSGLLTAMGYDYVPGNLAGGLALREADARAVRVDVAYFASAATAGQLSGGTRASAAGIFAEPVHALRGGHIVSERAARHVREFEVVSPAVAATGDLRRRCSSSRPAISIGATEQFALPRLHPQLRDVGVWLGWFGPASRPLQVMSAATELVTKMPGVSSAIGAVSAKLVKGSSGGPDADARTKARSQIVAVASDRDGIPLSIVQLEGVNPYDFTGAMLAWSAMRAAGGGLRGSGALGPVEGFGLDELEAGVREAGIERIA